MRELQTENQQLKQRVAYVSLLWNRPKVKYISEINEAGKIAVVIVKMIFFFLEYSVLIFLMLVKTSQQVVLAHNAIC